jgi:ribosomal protein S18 acetylase RimI-like enzyme
MSSPLCRILEWDSAFFGICIAQVTVNRLTSSSMRSVLNWCWEHHVRCLYFLCAPDDDECVQLVEAHRFHLVDIRLELVWRRTETSESRNLSGGKDDICSYHVKYRDDLLQIAETAYHDTRFYYDDHFTEEQSASLYREWIARSCDGFADAVWVATRRRSVTGYITCHIDSPDRGHIGLVGVKDSLRGSGIGRSLVSAAQTYFAQRGIEHVHVTTQGRNLPAQKLYYGCGFVPYAVHLWYHKWFACDDEHSAHNPNIQ